MGFCTNSTVIEKQFLSSVDKVSTYVCMCVLCVCVCVRVCCVCVCISLIHLGNVYICVHTLPPLFMVAHYHFTLHQSPRSLDCATKRESSPSMCKACELVADFMQIYLHSNASEVSDGVCCAFLPVSPSVYLI